MSKILDFSELIVTKLCHELAAPVGAVNNGVEFLEDVESREMHDKAMALISNNSKIAVAKIKFYRYLLGRSEATGESDISELKTLLRDFLDESKFHIVWSNESESEKYIQLTHRSARLMLALAIICSESMLHGGTIEIVFDKTASGKKFAVKGHGDKIKENSDIVHIIKDHELTDAKVANIILHLASKTASELGAIIHYDASDSHVSFEVSLN